MQPEIWEGGYFEVETDIGMYIVDAELVGVAPTRAAFAHYINGEIREIRYDYGYMCRLTMPGYLDCTDTAGFRTKKEAIDYLRETYGYEDEEMMEKIENL